LFVARETAKDLPELARQMSRLDERRAASHYAPPSEQGSKPLWPTELAAWYANEDNRIREMRIQRNGRAPDGQSEGFGSNAPQRRETRTGEVLSELERGDQSVRRAFARAATSLKPDIAPAAGGVTAAFSKIASALSVGITSLLADDRPRSPEDFRRRRDHESRRASEEQAAAESRRGNLRQRETEARELGEREASEIESQRKRRNDRQR